MLGSRGPGRRYHLLFSGDYLTWTSRRYPASGCQETAQTARLLVLRAGRRAGLGEDRLGRIDLARSGLLLGDGLLLARLDRWGLGYLAPR